MGAALGLTAFMLAFTFAVAQSHYEMRMQGMVEEARIARHAFMEADLLPEPQRSHIRDILRQYIADRVTAQRLVDEHEADDFLALVAKSERMHQQLWQLAVESDRSDRLVSSIPTIRPGQRGSYRGYVLGLMDIHAQRLQAALMNRIGSVIWIALYLTAALAMLVTGFQAGLTTRRSPVATVALALAFSLVLVLIIDLDRPLMTLFHMDNHVMVDLLEQMGASMTTGLGS